MVNAKVAAFINQELDGTLSKNDQVQLEKCLESDRETRELLANLRQLHKKLIEVQEVEPPEDVKENVMRALPLVRRPAETRESSFKAKIIELASLPRFQMAGMFSLGAAAALFFMVISQSLSNLQNAPAEKAIGTIISPDMITAANSIDSKKITIDDYEINVSTTRTDQTVFASIKLETASNQIVQLMVSSEAAENFRFNALEYSAPNLIYANFGNDFFSAAVAGPGNWVLAFDDPAGTTETIKIELKSEASSIRETVAIQKNAAQTVDNETSSNQ